MNDFILSCCSTADLTEEHFNSRNISYICFHYELNGKEYEDDLGKSVPFDQFYLALQNGASAKTSQVNADEFEHYFESFLKEGKDILHVTLSSGISGVINSAMIAKETLEERYPERKIYIVDSLGASSGYGLFMNRLADLRDNGYTLEQLYDWAMQHRLNLHHWFFSTDLTFYIKGGRISKTAGTIGGLLEMLYFAVCLYGQCKSCCRSRGGTFSKFKWKSRNSFYRHCDWKSHRSWNSSSVFLGQHADTLSSRYKPESFRHPNR